MNAVLTEPTVDTSQEVGLLDQKTITKTFKYPLILTNTQQRKLHSFLEKGKWLYNLCLHQREYAFALSKKSPNLYKEWQKQHLLKQGANAGTFSWQRAHSNLIQDMQKLYPDLKELPSGSITSINDQARQAYSDFFDNIKKKVKTQKPSDKQYNDSFSLHYRQKDTVIQHNGKERYAKVFGFSKIAGDEGLKVRYFRPTKGIPGQQRIVWDGTNWYLCITATHVINHINTKTNSVGIDMGVTRWIQLSTGDFKESPPTLLKLDQKKRKMQRALRRKIGGDTSKRQRQSNNYKKAYKKVAKIDKKIANTRHFYSKMYATEIARDNGLICVEKLNIKNMTKSAKGTIEAPGTKVRQKAGLNRAILMTAPYAFKTFLKQKSKEFGSTIIEVDPKYTSQTCSKCDFKDSHSRRTQSEFVCTSCGYEANADQNAAVNILNKGMIKLEK